MRFARVLVVTGLAAAGFAGGCDCTGGGPTPGNGRASLIGRFSDGDTVQSDGVSRLKISLTAIGADRKPDTKAIVITTPAQNGGFLANVDADFEAGNSLTGTPNAQGAFDFEFACTPDFDGTVALGADNGDAKATINVTCRKPQGEIVVDVDTTDCDDLQADGTDRCAVDITANLNANGVKLPFADQVSVKVTNVVPDDATATGNDQVIANTDAGVSNQISLGVSDVDGTGSFDVVAGLVPEVVTVEITAGDTVLTRDIHIQPFQNQGGVLLELDKTNVTGGNAAAAATLTITATDPRGGPPGPGDVINSVSIQMIGADGTSPGTPGATLSVAGGTAAAELTDVATDAAGKVDIVVNTPVVTEIETAVITVEYTRSIGGPIVPAPTVSLGVNPAGTVILNVSADPGVLHSDDQARLQSTLTIELTKDDTPVPGGTVDVTIPSDSTAVIRFATGDPITQTISNFTNGRATIDVVVNNQPLPAAPVPTTPAHVIAIGHDGNTDTPSVDVPIQVLRDPILQNVQFVSVVPNQSLGVLTSSGLPKSATVKFQLLDDTGAPMPNVLVRFAKNTTADPSITVQANAITDTGGFASTVLSSGNIPGPVQVVATATVGTITQVGLSQSITIVGSLPSFEKSFLLCTSGGDAGVVATPAPWQIDCSATLVDRTSNEIGGVPVQFQSEAGSEAAAETTQDGVASVTVSSDAIISPGADVSSWSYAAILPTLGDLLANLQNNPFTAAEANACFDGTLSTPCNLLDLCNDPGTSFFCPVPLECLADADVARGTLESPPTAIDVARNTNGARDEILDYIAKHRACGFPVSCLDARASGVGLSVTDGDQCPVNLGCMDFSGTTACPQNTVRTIMAQARGAEAFADINGNHVFDPQDVFVDLPEPFLDLNDNCVRDDLTQADRFFTQPIFAVVNTDIFSDVTGGQQYGFNDQPGSTSPVTRTNGVWDPDTTIFMNTHILEIGGPTLLVGEKCNSAVANHTCADGTVKACQETTAGVNVGIAACQPPDIVGAVTDFTLDYVWTDPNGNCPSEDMAEQAVVALDSDRTKIAGDTQLNLDAAACGYGDVTNPLMPECKAMPNLKTKLGTVNVFADCAELHGKKAGEVQFSLTTNGAKVVVPFAATCP